MSVFTKPAARAAARWSAVPAAAALAVVAAAAPALAAGTSVGINTSASVNVGQIRVAGAYQCATGAPYADLTVTVSQYGPHHRTTESSTLQHVTCTGAVLPWAASLVADEHGTWFTPGDTRVEVTLWTPGDVHGQADASLVVNAAVA
jgi:hypothetical protein